MDPEALASELKERIRGNASRIMRERGTYLAQLAREAGVPRSCLYERLRPGPHLSLRGLAEVAAVLDVDAQQLLEPLPAVRPPLVDGRRVDKSTKSGV
jgi:hypothetical protein